MVFPRLYIAAPLPEQSENIILFKNALVFFEMYTAQPKPYTAGFALHL